MSFIMQTDWFEECVVRLEGQKGRRKECGGVARAPVRGLTSQTCGPNACIDRREGKDTEDRAGEVGAEKTRGGGDCGQTEKRTLFSAPQVECGSSKKRRIEELT